MSGGPTSESDVLVSDKNGVRTITFNRPEKLNGWSAKLMADTAHSLAEAAKDDNVAAVILTGSGKYYSAGVDFAGGLSPMLPSKMKAMIITQNQELFEQFLDFPKPLFAAINGPAIGAAVTSATLCDGLIACEEATFLTPFKTLGLVPEGCSSYTFPKRFGAQVAKELLEGRKIDAKEALKLGFADVVVPADQLLATAQLVAERWVHNKTPRKIVSQGLHATLKEVNAKESVALANAIMDYPFLDHMASFSYEKGKYAPFMVFWIASFMRPLWSRL